MVDRAESDNKFGGQTFMGITENNFTNNEQKFGMLEMILLFSIGCGNANSQKEDTMTLSLKIASYNVHNAIGMDDMVDFDRVANVINDMEVDAIAIQEIDCATERSNGLVVLNELAKRTNMIPTLSASIVFDGGKYSNGILAKEQPLKREAIAILGREEERSLLIVELEHYVIYCTHLSLKEQDRQASIKLIQQQTEKYQTKPVFLAGDLNALHNSNEIRNLSASWILLSDSTQATYPSDATTEVIDYIFLKSNSAFSTVVKNAIVVDEPMASDHRPLWVEVTVEQWPKNLQTSLQFY